jgi:hypothetical protein
MLSQTALIAAVIGIASTSLIAPHSAAQTNIAKAVVIKYCEGSHCEAPAQCDPRSSSHSSLRAELESGQGFDGFACYLLSSANLIKALQIQPKLGRRAEEMRQAQSGVAGDGPLSLQNLCDTVGGNIELPRQRRRANLQFPQFLGEVLSRMNCHYAHHRSLLMVIDYLYVGRAACATFPFKANPPTDIDADAKLTFPIALQQFEMIAGERRKVLKTHSCFQPVQLQPGGVFNAGKRLYWLTTRESPGSFVPVAEDHDQF